MIEASDVAVVIPTRGNVDMEPIFESLRCFGFSDVSASDEDLGVYARYAAIEKTNAPVILSQDDDVILTAATVTALISSYEPGKIVCNVPERFRLRYKDSGMVGFGAIFDRDLPARAFERVGFNGYCSPWPEDDFERFQFDSKRHPDWVIPDGATFRRLCDIVFTMLTPVVKLDLPYTELPYARDESRMWRQPGHFEECDAMRKLCREVRDG